MSTPLFTRSCGELVSPSEIDNAYRYDEGTAFMPIVTNKNQLPLTVRDKYRFLAPDADAYDLPSDWYSGLSFAWRIHPTNLCL